MKKQIHLSFIACVLSLFTLTAHAHPTLEGAWIRLLPPNVTTTAAYVTINATHSDQLLAVTTDIAERVEMHETTMDDGVMSMRPIRSIELAENESTLLAPNGKHLMLIGLKRPLVEGEKVTLNFELKESPAMSHEFTVRKP